MEMKQSFGIIYSIWLAVLHMFLNRKTFRIIFTLGVDWGVTSPMKLGGKYLQSDLVSTR